MSGKPFRDTEDEPFILLPGALSVALILIASVVLSVTVGAWCLLGA
jgi:hypothetical protein